MSLVCLLCKAKAWRIWSIAWWDRPYCAINPANWHWKWNAETLQLLPIRNKLLRIQVKNNDVMTSLARLFIVTEKEVVKISSFFS